MLEGTCPKCGWRAPLGLLKCPFCKTYIRQPGSSSSIDLQVPQMPLVEPVAAPQTPAQAAPRPTAAPARVRAAPPPPTAPLPPLPKALPPPPKLPSHPKPPPPKPVVAARQAPSPSQDVMDDSGLQLKLDGFDDDPGGPGTGSGPRT
ncbi:hypothetical protein HY251_05205 [bacterium]|nr:hypothetical protein [bacterium]